MCEYDADCESLGEGEADAEQASIADNDGLKYLITHTGVTTSEAVHYIRHSIHHAKQTHIKQTMRHLSVPQPRYTGMFCTWHGPNACAKITGAAKGVAYRRRGRNATAGRGVPLLAAMTRAPQARPLRTRICKHAYGRHILSMTAQLIAAATIVTHAIVWCARKVRLNKPQT